MTKEASRRLANDHLALDQLLGQLKSALHAGDVEASHSRLDLFWARLAVHIRAEHLQLFPAVIDHLTHPSSAQTLAPTLSEAQSTIENLREDHDFFMHELAKAIGILRPLSPGDRATVDKGMNTVRSLMNEVEKRLMIHNHLEENKIYVWTTTILNSREQTELANRINTELANRPPRFSPNAWTT
jgi:Hemerythrin HHE cation binding domain.